MKINVIITDDHNISAEVVKTILESDPRFNVIKTCDNGLDAIESAQELNPDIILMDINMAPLDGFETTRIITEKNPLVKIIGFSVHEEPSYALKMLKNGGSGYITKTSASAEIINGIAEVFEGHLFICNEVKEKMKR
jgi:two-component system, NarL family, invasion response regulator UvrY